MVGKTTGKNKYKDSGTRSSSRESCPHYTSDGETEWFPRSQIRAEETADFGGLAGIAREFARDLIDPNFSGIEDDRLLDSVYRWMITGY